MKRKKNKKQTESRENSDQRTKESAILFLIPIDSNDQSIGMSCFSRCH